MVYILVCILDVVFNFFLIFPTRQVCIGSLAFTCPGMGLGVLGAALGTLLAWLTGTLILLYYISFRSKELRLSFRGRCRPERRMLKKAWKIGSPIGMERVISCAAQITSTMIVAPLGTVAIAANAFGITIESLCYMPGYGIGDAATTLVGQSIGAQRPDLIRRFSAIALALGVGAMSLLAIVMYIFAPDLMTLMTPDLGVRQLTTDVLRIEAWAALRHVDCVLQHIRGYGQDPQPKLHTTGKHLARAHTACSPSSRHYGTERCVDCNGNRTVCARNRDAHPTNHQTETWK